MFLIRRSLLKVTVPYISLIVAFAQTGCLDASSGEKTTNTDLTETDMVEPEVAIAAEAISGDALRSDVVKTIALNQGLWGSWTDYRYCPSGSRAVGYRLRVEQSQGSGDDSGLNAVELKCMNDVGDLTAVSAHDGLFGQWEDYAFCPNGSVITGGTIRFEGNRGSGDDTAANNLKVRCSNGNDIEAPRGMGYGSWQAAQTCPANSSVCGIKVRFEGNQGSGDDTALNAVEFACCTDSAQKTRLKVSYLG